MRDFIEWLKNEDCPEYSFMWFISIAIGWFGAVFIVAFGVALLVLPFYFIGWYGSLVMASYPLILIFMLVHKYKKDTK